MSLAGRQTAAAGALLLLLAFTTGPVHAQQASSANPTAFDLATAFDLGHLLVDSNGDGVPDRTTAALITGPSPTSAQTAAAAEIAARAAEQVFDALRAPIRRVTVPDVHIPFSPSLEKPLYPNADTILSAAREVLG